MSNFILIVSFAKEIWESSFFGRFDNIRRTKVVKFAFIHSTMFRHCSESIIRLSLWHNLIWFSSKIFGGLKRNFEKRHFWGFSQLWVSFKSYCVPSYLNLNLFQFLTTSTEKIKSIEYFVFVVFGKVFDGVCWEQICKTEFHATFADKFPSLVFWACPKKTPNLPWHRQKTEVAILLAFRCWKCYCVFVEVFCRER